MTGVINERNLLLGFTLIVSTRNSIYLGGETVKVWSSGGIVVGGRQVMWKTQKDGKPTHDRGQFWAVKYSSWGWKVKLSVPECRAFLEEWQTLRTMSKNNLTMQAKNSPGSQVQPLLWSQTKGGVLASFCFCYFSCCPGKFIKDKAPELLLLKGRLTKSISTPLLLC